MSAVRHEAMSEAEYLAMDANNWLLTVVTGLDASIELSSIGCTLALAEVYEKVTFAADDQEMI